MKIGQRLKKRLMRRADNTRLLLSLVFIIMVFVPLLRMFAHMDIQTVTSVISAPNFAESVRNSLVAAGLTTLIVVVLAYALAWCVERTTMRGKGIFNIIFALPMLIPSVSHGMGLIILLGNNGILSRLLGIDIELYGLTGIVLGSVLYAFPVAYLMIADIMKYEDGAPYEAAEVLGIPAWRRFAKITLPYLRKPMISVIFATFTLVVTDYGVPLMVGGKYNTIPVVMYQEVIGQLNFGKGAVYGSLLLIPAVVAFIMDCVNREREKNGNNAKPMKKHDGRGVRFAAFGLCGIICVMTLLPIVAFILLAFAKQYPVNLSATFDNIIKALNLRAGQYLCNSIVIAVAVAFLGTGIAFMTAYMAARMKSRASRFLHLSAVTSAAIPGIVLGLSYVLCFRGTPLYGTIAILIMVNTVHFIASPYLMIYNSLSKINGNMENVGHTLGISRMYMIRDVFVPMCRNTLLEMFAYFFVNSMMTISAVSFLATTANKPVSLMINTFEAQMQLGCAAVVSLMILVVNLLVKGIAFALKGKKGNHGVSE